MKIVFIIFSLGSGGAERVLTLLANYLCNSNRITIITFSKEKPFYDVDKRIQLIQLDLMRNAKNKLESLINTIKRIYILKKELKQLDGDVNISFMTHTNILSIIASKLIGKKIIVSERTVYDFYDSSILNLLRRYLYPQASYVITQTQADKQHYNFIDTIDVMCNPLVMPDNIDTKKENIILAVGRLDQLKGFDNLLEIFSRIDCNKWKLIIAGDGAEKENLIKLKSRLNLKNVEFVGKQKEIFDWYAKASIFVLPSRKEGFPNVLLEAMASGCAVVSFDCPYGPSEIITQGQNGLLIENQNSKELGNALEVLIHDRHLREKLAKEAIKVKEKYAIEQISKQWEEIIAKVVSG